MAIQVRILRFSDARRAATSSSCSTAPPSVRFSRARAALRGIEGKAARPQGEIRRFVNIYINDHDVRLLEAPRRPYPTAMK